MKREIFREYDIRGVVGEDITATEARLIGQALVQYLVRHGEKKGPIVVGNDHRLSSPDLAEALGAGICSTGWDVIYIGTVPTPAYYFALKSLNARGGIMITASHNPPEFNGFKVNHGRDSLFGDTIKELYDLIQIGQYPRGTGRSTTKDILGQYRQEITDRFQLDRPLKVVVDAGNGTAGLVAPAVLETLGCEVKPLFCDLDGHFPNHHPDPTVVANLQDLIAEVRQTKADLGIGYDGDADRIGVVDEHGAIIWGDRLLALFATDLLTRHPGAKIIFEVKCSLALEETIASAGGVPIMYKTGHSLIKKKMKEEQALLAGEMSGHMFFSENYYGYDDAIYASALLTQIVSRQPKPLSELMRAIPLYPSTPEIRLNCPEHSKQAIVSSLTEHFRAHYPVIEVDGVRVLFKNGWGLVRVSNTQPLLVLRFEARTNEELEAIISVFKRELAQFDQLELSALSESFSGNTG
ncbi:phosphomannomutase/phosphoglucomutase [bacterium]|nr:phosphomannomutase/phosphoglucomutase [bacterium]